MARLRRNCRPRRWRRHSLLRFADLSATSRLQFLTTDNAVRFARYWLALWIIPIGLAHFLYAKETYALVPTWIPFRSSWGYITGAGQIASGLGLIFNVLPRIAAWAEAIQIFIYALLVWLPAFITAPHARINPTAFAISWAIGAGAWVVAQNTPARQASAISHASQKPNARVQHISS